MSVKQELRWQIEGISDVNALFTDVLLTAFQGLGFIFAGMAIGTGSLPHFFIFLGITVASFISTFLLVRKEARKNFLLIQAQSGVPSGTLRLAERGRGRALMPLVAWIFALLFFGVTV